MADFDFEELDKAVTGALGSVADNSTPVKPTSPAGDRGAIPATREAPKVAERTQEVPAARRGSGRFMDMVHPASDMRSARPSSGAPAQSSPAVNTANAVSGLETTVSEPSPAAQPVFRDEAVVESQPLGSPFLPDAKVEKRPLGAPVPTSELSYEPLPSWGETPVDDMAIALENSDIAETSEPADDKEAQAADVAAVSPAKTELDDTPHSHETSHDEPDAFEQPAGPGSITQQYNEKPSSSPESGAIYDTESYHQPLAQPAKKQANGLWVILWIIGLILIGAAVGAAIYLYVLPLL